MFKKIKVWKNKRILMHQSYPCSKKEEAANLLGQLGDKWAVESLIKVLDEDVGVYVKVSIIKSLGILEDNRAVEPLMKTLNVSFNEEVREEAVRTLGKLGDTRAVPLLIKELRYEDFDYIGSAIASAEALGKLGDNSSVEPLLQALGDPVWHLRAQAAKSLGILGDKGSVSELLNHLGENFPNVRLAAAQSLSDIGQTEWQKLIKGDKSDFIRIAKSDNNQAINILINGFLQYEGEEALQALMTLKDKVDVESISSSLNDDDWAVRVRALKMLGKLGNDQAIANIIDAICDPNMSVRNEALVVFAKLLGTNASQKLKDDKISNSKRDRATREVIAEALNSDNNFHRLSAEKAVMNLSKMCLIINWETNNKYLHRCWSSKWQPTSVFILQAIFSEVLLVSDLKERTIYNLNNDITLNIVIKSLLKSDLQRKVASELLLKCGQPGWKNLTKSDSSDWDRLKASSEHREKIQELLINDLDDNDPLVRCESIESLQYFGDKGIVEHLIKIYN